MTSVNVITSFKIRLYLFTSLWRESFYQSNLVSFFPPRTCCHIFRTTLFWEKLLLHTFSEYLIRHSNYFFGTAISSEQLPFFLFFRTVTFSQELFFSEQLLFSERNFYRAGTFWEQEVLYGNYFSQQLFHPEELFRTKISKKELIF